ncbi:Ferredoxin-like protein in nif region [Hyella patelloides LEGE 07179]|uniref:Ferredoxin-like protein in nif region n=1 Tax=Hyella patelloides LEGE 07179 TaxID=945734 RepID=A0A563W136_9CYAN|nr:4Fe-4S binding protein [Hyella patelloides]VEP17347.1 Ferredoxin-like protein in nif region [Hyella patelloides LEGE 07179]
MTYIISNQCIACENCLPHCPTNAIQKNHKDKFSIDPNLCNDCVGSYGVPQCMAGCPTFNGCTPTVSSLIKSTQTTTSNYWDDWFSAYNRLTSRLKAKQETQYWQRWFDLYSQKLEHLVVSH